VLVHTKGGVVASWSVRSSPDQAVRVQTLAGGHCIVFLGKTLNSHSASLHPGVSMGTGEFNAGGNPAMDWPKRRLYHWYTQTVIQCTLFTNLGQNLASQFFAREIKTCRAVKTTLMDSF